MTDHPGPAHRPARSRRLTMDQAAMLAVTISVGAILGAMGVIAVTLLPGESAESAAEPPPVTSTADPEPSATAEPEVLLEYTTTDAVDPESPEGVAALWHEASINDNLEALEPRTCANPSSAVAERVQEAQTDEEEDLDFIASNIFVTSRELNGVTEVAIFLVADDPTYDYIWDKVSRPGDIIAIMTVVQEDSAWKVCHAEGFV
jgi:hypothetical protein